MPIINKTINLDDCYKKIAPLNQSTLYQLSKIFRNYFVFNVFFFILICVQSIFLGLFFTFILKNSLFTAIFVASLFFTFFFYFMLRLYFKTQRPIQLMNISEQYLQTCKQFLRYQEGIAEYHILFANLAQKFANELEGKQEAIVASESKFKIFPSMKKLHYLWHWQDWFEIKKFFINQAIEEQIKRIKYEPLNLEAHASLANGYVLLSNLYQNVIKTCSTKFDILSDNDLKHMKEKFEESAKRAIEEFEILNEYAPNDAWVHYQLACNYNKLQMPAKEIEQYEKLMQLHSDDKEILFRLGILYFQQGKNAKGLQIYSKIKKTFPSQAENLIKFYGA